MLAGPSTAAKSVFTLPAIAEAPRSEVALTAIKEICRYLQSTPKRGEKSPLIDKTLARAVVEATSLEDLAQKVGISHVVLQRIAIFAQSTLPYWQQPPQFPESGAFAEHWHKFVARLKEWDSEAATQILSQRWTSHPVTMIGLAVKCNIVAPGILAPITVSDELTKQGLGDPGSSFSKLITALLDYQLNSKATDLLESMGHLAVAYSACEFVINLRTPIAAHPQSVSQKYFVEVGPGSNFSRHFYALERGTSYVLIDPSPFVKAYLDAYTLLLDISNVEVRKEAFQEASFAAHSVGTLRIRGLEPSIPSLGEEILSRINWIDPLGQLVLECEAIDRRRIRFAETFHEMIGTLAKEGWGLVADYNLRQQELLASDRFILSRTLPSDQTVRHWKKYLKGLGLVAV